MGCQVLALYWPPSHKRTTVTMQWLLAQNKQRRDSAWLQEEQIYPLQSRQNTPQVPDSTTIMSGSLALVLSHLPQLFLPLPELRHHSGKIILVLPYPRRLCTMIYLATASFLKTKFSPDPRNWAPSGRMSSFSGLPHLERYTSHCLPTKPSGHPLPCSGSTGLSGCSLLPHFICTYTLLLVTSLPVQTLIRARSGSPANCPEVTSNSEDIIRWRTKKISRKKRNLTRVFMPSNNHDSTQGKNKGEKKKSERVWAVHSLGCK